MTIQLFPRPLVGALDPARSTPENGAVALLGCGYVNGELVFFTVDRIGVVYVAESPRVRVLDPDVQAKAALAARLLAAGELTDG